MTPPLHIETLYDGAVERLVLNRPKANILDTEMVGALCDHIGGLRSREELRLVLFEGAGSHFSFGASVPEHLPGRVERMLPVFHDLFRVIESLGVPTAALLRGQCLGGGFELATWCGRVFASTDVNLAVPEITLGVFPPVAAMGLRWRVGGARATELVLTGQSVDAGRALDIGLVDEVDDALEASWRAWYEGSLAPRSAHGLRMAWRAARRPLQQWLEHDLPALERMYLGELMQHPDPVEGLTAFVERRPPQWRTP